MEPSSQFDDRSKRTMAIPVELRDPLAKMEFLSKIPRNSKININPMSFVQCNSWYGAFIRAFKHENRKTTLNFIEQVIDHGIELLHKYRDSPFLRLISTTLASARTGIKELQDTYYQDPEMTSHLSICLKNIDLQLERLESWNES